MIEKHNFNVTGSSHYQDSFIALAYDNPDYSMSKKEICEIYSDGDIVRRYEYNPAKVDLIPEPDNEYDPNAIRVDIKGYTIGYIKRGSCSQVKNLLASGNAVVTLEKIQYGPEKRVFTDEDGNIVIDEYVRSPFVSICITTGEEEQEPEPIPAKVSAKHHAARKIILTATGVFLIYVGIHMISQKQSGSVLPFILALICLFFAWRKRRK